MFQPLDLLNLMGRVKTSSPTILFIPQLSGFELAVILLNTLLLTSIVDLLCMLEFLCRYDTVYHKNAVYL